MAAPQSFPDTQDRGEREFYERIAELYLKIAQELEAMLGG